MYPSISFTLFLFERKEKCQHIFIYSCMHAMHALANTHVCFLLLQINDDFHPSIRRSSAIMLTAHEKAGDWYGVMLIWMIFIEVSVYALL